MSLYWRGIMVLLLLFLSTCLRRQLTIIPWSSLWPSWCPRLIHPLPTKHVLVQWVGLTPEYTTWKKWDDLNLTFHLEDKVLFPVVGVNSNAEHSWTLRVQSGDSSLQSQESYKVSITLGRLCLSCLLTSCYWIFLLPNRICYCCCAFCYFNRAVHDWHIRLFYEYQWKVKWKTGELWPQIYYC